MFRRSIFIVFVLIPLAVLSTAAQQVDSPSQVQLSVGDLLEKAAVRRKEYEEVFKDLHAEETQVSEDYGANGEVKKRRVIVADLFIYQPPGDQKTSVEYRNVRSVDGKQLRDSNKRAEQLFARLARSSSVQLELENIDRESRRYDLRSSFYGYTLHQSIVLDSTISPHYRFTIAASEKLDGHDVIVLDYQQVSPSPTQRVDLNLPKPLLGAVPLFRGRLWIDRSTFQLRKELQELTLEIASSKVPLVFIRSELRYVDSAFGILTPKQILMRTYTNGRNRPDGSPELLVGSQVSFDYGKFSRFEVTPEYRTNE